MKTGDTIFMVVVIGVAVLLAILKAILKGNLPNWLGFVLMIAASLVAIVGGAATQSYKTIPIGVAGALGSALAWISGATSSGEADSDTLGGVAKNIPLWAWLIIAGLVAAAILVTIFIR